MNRKPAEPERAVWTRAMRGVAPLRSRPEAPVRPPAASPPSPVRPDPVLTQPARPPAPALTLDRFAGIDRANAERLKRGRHRIEARLDLHGMTQAEAHHALGGFIHGARAAGKRCVLVITGRGRREADGGGVLREAVPRWLAEPGLRPHLLAIATAQPRDGGAGALYVMLRRSATMDL